MPLSSTSVESSQSVTAGRAPFGLATILLPPTTSPPIVTGPPEMLTPPGRTLVSGNLNDVPQCLQVTNWPVPASAGRAAPHLMHVHACKGWLLSVAMEASLIDPHPKPLRSTL